MNFSVLLQRTLFKNETNLISGWTKQDFELFLTAQYSVLLNVKKSLAVFFILLFKIKIIESPKINLMNYILLMFSTAPSVNRFCRFDRRTRCIKTIEVFDRTPGRVLERSVMWSGGGGRLDVSAPVLHQHLVRFLLNKCK